MRLNLRILEMLDQIQNHQKHLQPAAESILEEYKARRRASVTRHYTTAERLRNDCDDDAWFEGQLANLIEPMMGATLTARAEAAHAPPPAAPPAAPPASSAEPGPAAAVQLQQLRHLVQQLAANWDAAGVYGLAARDGAASTRVLLCLGEIKKWLSSTASGQSS